MLCFFFFQAEDGIRDKLVTGVQTCALPILAAGQLGAYAVPINWHFTPEEAGYILGDCAAKVLVAHTDLLTQIAPGIPAWVKVLAVPTPEEIAAAYNVPVERRQAPAGIETWD